MEWWQVILIGVGTIGFVLFFVHCIFACGSNYDIEHERNHIEYMKKYGGEDETSKNKLNG